MNKNGIEGIIKDFREKGEVTDYEEAMLNKNLEVIKRVMRERGVLKDDRASALAVCKYILNSSKYAFRQAFTDSFFESEEEFYWKRWTKPVELACGKTTVSCAVSELYETCSSALYLDLRTELIALDYLNGRYTEEELKELLSVMDECGISCEVSESEEENLPSVFDAILSVEDLRGKVQDNYWREVATELKERAIVFFRKSVFQGIISYQERIAITDECMLKKIRKIIEECDFSFCYAVDKVTDVWIKPLSQRHDYSVDYSEDELRVMVNNSEQGGTFYFVATYCERVLLSKLTKMIVQDLVDAQERVLNTDDSLVIVKRDTYTPVYMQLHCVLKTKGYEVVDGVNAYELRWHT